MIVCVVAAAVPSPMQIAGGIIDSILDEMFPAEKAASDTICTLLDKVMASLKRRGLFASFCWYICDCRLVRN